MFKKRYRCYKDKIQQGAMALVMEDIIKQMDDTVLMELSLLEVKLSCFNNNKSNMSRSKGMGRSMGYLQYICIYRRATGMG